MSIIKRDESFKNAQSSSFITPYSKYFGAKIGQWPRISTQNVRSDNLNVAHQQPAATQQATYHEVHWLRSNKLQRISATPPHSPPPRQNRANNSCLAHQPPASIVVVIPGGKPGFLSYKTRARTISYVWQIRYISLCIRKGLLETAMCWTWVTAHFISFHKYDA